MKEKLGVKEASDLRHLILFDHSQMEPTIIFDDNTDEFDLNEPRIE
jgi:hypothetical protein